MPQQYSISELAQEFDLTTRTIRHYEEEGLLQPQRQGGQRVYSHGDRTRLKLILRGRRLGFSLPECRELIELYDPLGDNRTQLHRLLEKIAERRRQLAQQRKDIDILESELTQAEQRCWQALQNIDAPPKDQESL